MSKDEIQDHKSIHDFMEEIKAYNLQNQKPIPSFCDLAKEAKQMFDLFNNQSSKSNSNLNSNSSTALNSLTPATINNNTTTMNFNDNAVANVSILNPEPCKYHEIIHFILKLFFVLRS